MTETFQSIPSPADADANAARALVARYYAAFNADDRPAMLDCLADDVVHDISQGGSERGRDAFARFMTRMDAHYAERLTDVVTMASADGTRAAAEYVVHGTYRVTDQGLPPAHGQTYALPGGAFFEIRDGRLSRVSNHYNLVDWIAQVTNPRDGGGARRRADAVTAGAVPPMPRGLRLVEARGQGISPHAGALARLRIAVFAEWPYLYAGHADYETAYLGKYAATPGAYAAVVYADAAGLGTPPGSQAIGAATALPMAAAEADVSAPLVAAGEPLADWFYFGESLLLPAWRGRGLGHRFFDLREAEARRQGARHAAFLRVVRPADHPRRPAAARDLDAFWRGRGYRPHPDWRARFSWPDVGTGASTPKDMEFWTHAL